MKRHTIILAAALVAVASPLLAQVPSRVVMGGKAVTMVADVVYAFPSARSRVVAVGGTDQGLGVFLGAVHPGFSSLPPFDRQAGIEAYAAFNPDLVILKSSLKKSLGTGLETLGIQTAYLSLETPEDYYKDLAAVGRVFGDSARAALLVSYYRGVVETAATAAATALRTGVARKPRVLLAQAAGDGFEVPPDGWMQSLLVELAGGIPVWKGANPAGGWAKIGPEQIAAWDPDVFIVVSYREPATAVAARTAADSRYAGLRAAKNGTLVGFAQDFLSWDQPDTRWGLGLLWLSNLLYPGAIPGYSAEAEARRFFQLFYDLDAASFDANVRPRLRGISR
ncbi:MAG: ABC transporter substrate-binding protein [Spirochaetales bacterium]|nr:ABC transporter substrate-binding protein [Spirochaetales bacterium]